MSPPDAEPVRETHVERAIDAVRACAAADAVSALAFDVLSRQAEGRALYAGEKHARARAEEHGVTREAAETAEGNVLAIIERGAREPVERALVAGFAVRGLAGALEGEERAQRVFRFVRHADWLELTAEHPVYPFVDALLDEEAQAAVYREVAQAIVDEAAGRDGGRADVRARNAARLTALAASSSDAAKSSLRDVIRSAALDEPTRLMASALAGDGATPSAVRPRLEGRLGRAPRARSLEVARWLSGWALGAWLVRALLFLVGVRHRAELRLADGGLEVRTELSMLGRTIRVRNETWRLDSLEGLVREVRFPALHLAVGALALALGVLLGAIFLFDGARSGELVLLAIAAALVVGGAGLDLALDVLVPGSRGRVVVDVVARARRPLRLTRVPLLEADTFLRAVSASAARR